MCSYMKVYEPNEGLVCELQKIAIELAGLRQDYKSIEGPSF